MALRGFFQKEGAAIFKNFRRFNFEELPMKADGFEPPRHAAHIFHLQCMEQQSVMRKLVRMHPISRPRVFSVRDVP